METKEQLKKELDELKRRKKWDDESKARYNSLLETLLQKLNLSIDEKLELVLTIYPYLRIKKVKQNEYIFETPIRMGWCSKHFKTISEGIDWLLRKN